MTQKSRPSFTRAALLLSYSYRFRINAKPFQVAECICKFFLIDLSISERTRAEQSAAVLCYQYHLSVDVAQQADHRV